MEEEYQALLQLNTWQLVPPPDHSTILGCHWVFKLKTHSDGSNGRYKARLVAQGNQQTYGDAFLDTFSPMAKFPTLRILLTIVVTHNWSLFQLDVSNAFLHGHLDDTIYMKQLPGFQNSLYPKHVCLLKKSIYGLKQSSRQ